MYVQFRFGPIFCWPFAFFFSLSQYPPFHLFVNTTRWPHILSFSFCVPQPTVSYSHFLSLYIHTAKCSSFWYHQDCPSIHPSIYLSILPSFCLSFSLERSFCSIWHNTKVTRKSAYAEGWSSSSSSGTKSSCCECNSSQAAAKRTRACLDNDVPTQSDLLISFPEYILDILITSLLGCFLGAWLHKRTDGFSIVLQLPIFVRREEKRNANVNFGKESAQSFPCAIW